MNNNYQDRQNNIYLEQKQLQSILSNRRHLDFALKLALGSQAYLHDISQIKDESIASFESFQNQFSPLKPQKQSPIAKKVKKSRFGEKENIINSVENLSLQKSLLSNTPQSRWKKQEIQKIYNWMNYIKQNHIFIAELKNSKISQKSSYFNAQKYRNNQKSRQKFGDKSRLNIQTKNSSEDINSFFKQVVYRLQKLQIIQKQEYNDKLLLCQLTQSTIRQHQLSYKLEGLMIDLKKTNEVIANKQVKIQQLEAIIEEFNKKQRQTSKNVSQLQFKNSNPLAQSNKTQSYLTFSISDLTEVNPNYVASTSSIKLKNKLPLNLKQQNVQKINESPQKREKQDFEDNEGPETAVDSNKNNKRYVKFQNQKRIGEQQNGEKSKQISEQSMLLMSLDLKQQYLKPCRLFQKDLAIKEEKQCVNKQQTFYEVNCSFGEKQQNKAHISQSYKQISSDNPNQNQLHSYLQQAYSNQTSVQTSLQSQQSQFNLQQIKQDVKQLIEQNQTLKTQLNKLSEEINYLRDIKNNENFIQLPVLNVDNEKVNNDNLMVEDSTQFIASNMSRQNVTCEVETNKTVDIQSNKACRIRNISLASHVIEHNQISKRFSRQTCLNTEASLSQSARLMTYQQLQKENKSLEQKLMKLEEENSQMKRKILQFMKLYNGLQNQNEDLKLKLIESQNEANQIEENILKIVEMNCRENQNLQEKQQEQDLVNINLEDQKQNNLNTQNCLLPAQNPTTKNCKCSPQSRKSLLQFIQRHKILIQRLKKKSTQLKNIKNLMRKAKQINQKDIQYLKTTIQKNKQLRLIQLQNLKKQQQEWKQRFIYSKTKQLEQIKQKGMNLKLKLNKTMFKFCQNKNKMNKGNKNKINFKKTV